MLEPLSASDALERIARKRADHAALERIRSAATPILSGRDCLVVCSALRIEPAQHDCAICVNSSGYNASRIGIDNPELTIMAGWTLRGDNDKRRASLEALRGRRTKTVAFLESGCDEAHARSALRALDFRYDGFFRISSIERAVILGDVCGADIATGKGSRDRRPSNGCLAAALALWVGAKAVTMTGFSLADGHVYLPTSTRRHIAGDSWFIDRVGERVKLV